MKNSLGYYLAAGAVISILSGLLLGAVPLIAIEIFTGIDLLEDHPWIAYPLAFVFSTVILSYIYWRSEIGKYITEAKRTGRAVTTNVRGYYVKFLPDGKREILGKIAGY